MAKPRRKASKTAARSVRTARSSTRGGNGHLLAPAIAQDGRVLTPRELQCLQLLSNGLRSEQIAFELKVARVTVDFHIANAKTKLNAITREQAIATAMRGGLFS